MILHSTHHVLEGYKSLKRGTCKSIVTVKKDVSDIFKIYGVRVIISLSMKEDSAQYSHRHKFLEPEAKRWTLNFKVYYEWQYLVLA